MASREDAEADRRLLSDTQELDAEFQSLLPRQLVDLCSLTIRTSDCVAYVMMRVFSAVCCNWSKILIFFYEFRVLC
jgi:hypothetical protein